jgi:hypothetical protein
MQADARMCLAGWAPRFVAAQRVPNFRLEVWYDDPGFISSTIHSFRERALTSSGPSTERRITSNYRTWWLTNTLAKKGFGFSAPFNSESVLNLE